MRRLEPPSSHYDRIEGLRIGRHDVEFIIELFRRDVGLPKLSDDQFEFESLDEFIEHKGVTPTKLEVEATTTEGDHRRISAKFEGNSVSLSGSRDTPFHEARNFLRAKRPWKYHALNPWPWFFVAVVATGVLSVIAEIAEKKQEPIPTWPIYLVIVSLIQIAVGFLYRKF